MLWQRVLTALVAAPLFFGIVLFGSNHVQLLFWLVVVLLSAHELAPMLRFLGSYRWLYSGLVALFSLAALFFSEQAQLGMLTVVSALWVLFVPYALQFYSQHQRLPLDNTLLALLCTLQLAAFLVAVVDLSLHLSAWALLALFVVVWCADIGAYFVGRKFGKTPLAATISPKKTREGLLGGVVASLVVAYLAHMLFGFGVSRGAFVSLSALVVIYSAVGDLWESILKRRVGLKDSGTILPGHGGVLDRIDSWLVAFPLWALGLSWLGG